MKMSVIKYVDEGIRNDANQYAERRDGIIAQQLEMHADLQ